jgi:hypothetical protein
MDRNAGHVIGVTKSFVTYRDLLVGGQRTIISYFPNLPICMKEAICKKEVD